MCNSKPDIKEQHRKSTGKVQRLPQVLSWSWTGNADTKARRRTTLRIQGDSAQHSHKARSSTYSQYLCGLNLKPRLYLRVVLNFVNILKTTELYTGIPCFTLPHFTVPHRYCIFFFTNSRFVATLHQASLLASFSQ